jgi:hypothetical protein
LEFSGAIYQLTGRGKARQKGFFTAADRELFLMSTVQIVQVVQSFHSVQKVHFGERSIRRTTCKAQTAPQGNPAGTMASRQAFAGENLWKIRERKRLAMPMDRISA